MACTHGHLAELAADGSALSHLTIKDRTSPKEPQKRTTWTPKERALRLFHHHREKPTEDKGEALAGHHHQGTLLIYTEYILLSSRDTSRQKVKHNYI
jgi:hypothetical protein